MRIEGLTASNIVWRAGSVPVLVRQVSALAFEFKLFLGASSFVGLLLVAIGPLGSDSFYSMACLFVSHCPLLSPFSCYDSQLSLFLPLVPGLPLSLTVSP